jgi:hypothetical protein
MWDMGEETCDRFPRLVFSNNFPFRTIENFALRVVGNLWRLLAYF